MDVQKKLDEIVAAVSAARSMPMSASCVVNRAALLAMLDEVRAALPDSLSQAEALIGGRDQMAEEARADAQRIIEQAHAERGSLISETGVVRQSQAEAERILAEARQEAAEIRAEADDYVDSKLANFEVVLTKTIGSVDRGHEKLLGHGPGLDEHGFVDEDAPERSADPETLRSRADDYVDAKFGAFKAVLSKTLEAVGRGRLKLTGHRAVDELGAQMAAQDAADAANGGMGGQSDDEYLAGLAAAAAPGDYRYDPSQNPAQSQSRAQQPQTGGYGHPQPDPYQQRGHQQYADPYAAQQAQAQQAQPTQQAQQAAYYDPNYGWQHQPQQAQQPYARQQPAALDETSFFDTGMIDLDRLRELEQGH